MYFKNKTYLLTGCSSGLGWELAHFLINYGAKVVGIARRKDKLEQLSDTVANSDNLVTLCGDISNDQDCVEFVQLAIKNYKSIDGIILNAGVSVKGYSLDLGIEHYSKAMEINYYATINLIKKTYQYIEKQAGDIVIIGSLLGIIPMPYRSGYVASKHALIGWAESFRIEKYTSKVNIMVVNCGYMKTEISANSITNDPSLIKGVSEASKKGSDPKLVASKILKGMIKKKSKLYPIKKSEKVMLYLYRYFPNILEKKFLQKITID